MQFRMGSLELVQILHKGSYLFLVLLLLGTQVGRYQHQPTDLAPNGIIVPIASLETQLRFRLMRAERLLPDQYGRLDVLVGDEMVLPALDDRFLEVFVALLQEDDVDLPLLKHAQRLHAFLLLVDERLHVEALLKCKVLLGRTCLERDIRDGLELVGVDHQRAVGQVIEEFHVLALLRGDLGLWHMGELLLP